MVEPQARTGMLGACAPLIKKCAILAVTLTLDQH
jgi:hypothetical protein